MAARELEARYGLASVEGGRHAGWGSANRIVPLGDAVAAGMQTALAPPLGWVARTDRLDDVASRLGLTVSAGSRAGQDGRLLRWRVAGVESPAAEPALPLFVEWGQGTPLPGGTPVTHRAGAVGIVLAGDHGEIVIGGSKRARPAS